MTAEVHQPVQKVRKSSVDDFKVIHGIGSSVEDRLHKAGILTYRQLSEKSSQEIARILNGMVGFTPERIAAQDWNGQAMQYASGRAAFEEESENHELQNGQHYAVFTLELLLDGENRVRRTRVMHVQSQKDESWAGWDGERLQDFFKNQASLYVPARSEATLEAEFSIDRGSPPTPQPEVEPVMQTPRSGITGEVHILSMLPQYPGSSTAIRLIPANQPFNMRITLDLSGVIVFVDTPMRYTASIYAKEVGAGPRQMIGTVQGMFRPANNAIIDIGAYKLSRGFYRMDAIVALSLPDQEPQLGSSPMALMEGGLFQVY